LLDLGFLEHTCGEILSDINDSGSTIRATTTLRLKLSKNFEQVVTLGGKEINLSVGMHSEGKRSLWGQFVLNVLKIFAMNLGNGALERSFSFSEGEKLSLVKELIVEEVLEVSSAQKTIPIVNNVTTVHDFSNEILQIIPWYLSGTTSSVHIVLQHNGGITEITIREGISHVESFRSKLSALAHDRVEECKTEQDSSDLTFPLIELLRLVGDKGSVHVGLESSGRLVGQLN